MDAGSGVPTEDIINCPNSCYLRNEKNMLFNVWTKTTMAALSGNRLNFVNMDVMMQSARTAYQIVRGRNVVTTNVEEVVDIIIIHQKTSAQTFIT